MTAAILVLALLGLPALTFIATPGLVIRTWAVLSQRVYSGANKKYARLLDSIPLGRLQRNLTGMPLEQYINEAANNPRVSIAMIWYVRLVGLLVLVPVLVTFGLALMYG